MALPMQNFTSPRKLVVAAVKYELARWFATTNHVHHDDLVFLGVTADLYKLDGIKEPKVWVLGHPHELLMREVRVVAERRGGSLHYAEAFEVVSLG